MKFEFLDWFSKNTRISNFIEIRPVGTEFFHSDGQADGHTDMTMLIDAFHTFVNAPKNELSFCFLVVSLV